MKKANDRTIKNLAGREKFEVPRAVDIKIENILADLPEKKGFHLRWKSAVIVAAALSLVFSCTAWATVNYVRQRMETLNEEKIEEYFANFIASPMEADSYLREFSDAEKERLVVLEQAYTLEGRFPEGELKLLEDEKEYNKKGVAFVPIYSMYFFPEEEMTDEELLQYIDFNAKRSYSLEIMNKKIEAGEEQAPGLDSSKQAVEAIRDKIISNKENIVKEYKGELKAVFSAPLGDAIFFSEGRALWNEENSYLYRMEAGEDNPVRLKLQPPEGMQFWILAGDTEENMNVFLIENETKFEKPGRYLVWKIDKEGNLLKEIDVSDALKDQTSFPVDFAIDSMGRYYFNGLDFNVVITDGEGKFMSTVKDGNKSLRAVGRGKDGKVYASILEGEDYKPGIVQLDAENGIVGKTYSNILPGGVGAFTKIAAGANCDFLVFGDGIYSYNLGDEKAELTIPRYELPVNKVNHCFLEDGRYFASDGVYGEFSQDKMDFLSIDVERFYWIPAEK